MKDPEFFNKLKKEAEGKEEKNLFPQASFSKDHSRYFGREDDHRLPYKRDVDRIVLSKAYARYIDKTQVVYLVENDHITHRSLHVQLVSTLARGIAEILNLNLGLVEAISLGHDVGHPPFGHEGEGYLSALSKEYGNGYFAHPVQSCRLFSLIEPLNLGLNVYDGFLCHDGGLIREKYQPQFGKSWERHEKEKKEKLQDPEINLWPASLEGCLVKLCDTISYIGKDIEDAIQIGIISREAVPKTVLGNTNREIVSVVAQDIIQNSFGKPYIFLSDEVFVALDALRKFNFENIYKHPNLKVESAKIKESYRYLFEALLKEYERGKEDSFLWKNFLSNKTAKYLSTTTPVQSVIDYISGMTDSFFIRTLEKILVPKRIVL